MKKMENVLQKRIQAYVLDVLILNIPLFLCLIVMTIDSTFFKKGYYIFIKFFLKYDFLIFFLGTLFKDSFGRSIGKKVFKLKIITSSGKKPTFLQLILRNVISFVWFVEAFIIFVLKKPRFGDAIAGTIVVSESKGNDH